MADSKTSASSPVALITGAASGMGLALTRHLVSKGWRVAMCDVNAVAGEKQSQAINGSLPGGESRTVFRKVDITDYAQQATFFKEVFEWSGGHIDYFAANAGIMEVGSLFESVKNMKLEPTSTFPLPPSTKPVDINFRAVLEGIWLYRFFHDQRKPLPAANGKKPKLPRGRITVTASSSGLYPFHGQVQYTSTKHACIGIVRSSAVPLRKENISINAVCPSFVATALIPKDFLAAWPKEHLVPMESVLRAHDLLIEDGKGEKWEGVVGRESAHDTPKKLRGSMITGEALELSQEEIFFRKPVAYPNESQRWLNEDSAEFFRDVERQKALQQRERAREAKL